MGGGLPAPVTSVSSRSRSSSGSIRTARVARAKHFAGGAARLCVRPRLQLQVPRDLGEVRGSGRMRQQGQHDVIQPLGVGGCGKGGGRSRHSPRASPTLAQMLAALTTGNRLSAFLDTVNLMRPCA